MKNSKKVFGNAGQSATEVKKPHKHDANLQKNSTLYFQIGLILCLLGTYSLFEMQFQDKKIVVEDDFAQVDPIEIEHAKFKLEVIEPEKIIEPPKKKSVQIIDKIKPVDDDKKIAETDVVTPDSSEPDSKPANVGDIPDIDVPIDLEPIPFPLIEKVPVYPGCEKMKTNADRKKCMSAKITKLIYRKFNGDVGSQYGISGKQRIQTQFTIDKNGNVVDIKIRGPHSALEKEAKRVINKIPKMEPGMQRNVPVGVIYTLPILYDARD